MSTSEQQWVVEWSVEQSCFHITTLDESVTMNMEMVLRGARPQYVIVYMAESPEDASEFCNTNEAAFRGAP